MTSYVDKPSIADAQTGARVLILSYKHAGMVSLSYFEKQILTLQPYYRESFLFIFICYWLTVYLCFLIVMAGDVEVNPGPVTNVFGLCIYSETIYSVNVAIFLY